MGKTKSHNPKGLIDGSSLSQGSWHNNRLWLISSAGQLTRAFITWFWPSRAMECMWLTTLVCVNGLLLRVIKMELKINSFLQSDCISGDKLDVTAFVWFFSKLNWIVSGGGDWTGINRLLNDLHEEWAWTETSWFDEILSGACLCLAGKHLFLAHTPFGAGANDVISFTCCHDFSNHLAKPE